MTSVPVEHVHVVLVPPYHGSRFFFCNSCACTRNAVEAFSAKVLPRLPHYVCTCTWWQFWQKLCQDDLQSPTWPCIWDLASLWISSQKVQTDKFLWSCSPFISLWIASSHLWLPFFLSSSKASLILHGTSSPNNIVGLPLYFTLSLCILVLALWHTQQAFLKEGSWTSEVPL